MAAPLGGHFYALILTGDSFETEYVREVRQGNHQKCSILQV